MAKANSVVGMTIGEGTLTITVKGAGPDGGDETLVFDPTRVDPGLRARAELMGWAERLGDAAAMSRDPATGLPASPRDKWARVKDLADWYTNGAVEWSRKRAGGEAKVPGGSIVLAAVAEVYGIGVDEARARVEALAERKAQKPGEVLRALAKDPRIIPIIARIKAGRAGAEGGAMLDELAGE